MFVIVSWPVALAVLLTLWTARLTVATLHLTWRVTLFLCRLLGMFVVWASDKIASASMADCREWIAAQ